MWFKKHEEHKDATVTFSSSTKNDTNWELSGLQEFNDLHYHLNVVEQKLDEVLTLLKGAENK